MDTLIKLLADGLMVPIVLIGVGSLLFAVPRSERYDRYTRIFMAGLTSYYFAKIIGALWQPETLRPFEKLGIEAGASYLNNPGFPSDHALFAMFLTLAVWYGTRNRKLAVTMLVLTVLVCIGRVLAHVHTPLDVTGGIGVAMLGAVWYGSYAKKRVQRRLAKTSNK